MADVDDELLALAGGDSSDEGTQSPDEHQVVDKPKSRPKPKAAAASSKKRSSSTSKTKGSASKKQKRDEIDSDEDEEVQDHRRRQHSQDDDEEEEDDDDDDDDDDDLETLYPVEGIYKSAQEREDFLDMPEFEREEILAQRRDEVNSLKQASELRRMVAAQKAGSKRKGGRRGGGSDDEDSDYGTKSKGRTIKKTSRGTAANAAKNRKRSAPGSNSTKSAKLQELKKRREDKAKKVAKANSNRRDEDDDDDDDEEDASSSDEDDGESSDFRDDDDDEPSSKRKGRNVKGSEKRDSKDSSNEPPSLIALNRARLTRELIEKMMYRPGWTAAMRGSFIRYNWIEKGPDDKTRDKYRVHEVLGTREGKRHYDIGGGKFTKVLVEVDFADRRQELPMSQISNQDFIPEERERWILIQQAQSGRSRSGKPLPPSYPSNQSLFEQGEDLREYLQKSLTDSDVSKMLSAKKEARLAFEEEKRNYHSKLGRNVEGSGNNNGGNGGISRSGGTTSAEKAMAEMNAKHRNEDRVRIYEAEKKSAMAKRAAMGLNPSNSSTSLSRSSSSNGLNTNTNKNENGFKNGDSKSQDQDSKEKNSNLKSQFPTLNAAQSIDVDLGDF